jgi:hypothetical protein
MIMPQPSKLALRLLDDIVEGIRQFRAQLDDAFKPGRFQPEGPWLTTAVLIFFVIMLGGLVIARLLERL